MAVKIATPADNLKKALALLRAKGYVLVKASDPTVPTIKIDTARFIGKSKTRLGIVSDTHFGSKYQQITFLHELYSLFAKRGIRVVLHGGDLTDGTNVYRGMEYEQFLHGSDEQSNYAIAHYPKQNGITTYICSGNHDDSFQSRSGISIVERICHDRPDLKFVGHYGGTIILGDLKVFLMHGHGGNSYARSYKQQKIIEQLPAGEKPHLLVTGNWHITNFLPVYRNVAAILPGCFQSQTPYLLTRGLYPDLGGWIVEFEMNKDKTIAIRFEFMPFYVPKKKDY